MNCLIIGGAVDNKVKESSQNHSFEEVCIEIGRHLADLGHSLSVCSPYEDSADYWVFKGFTERTSSDGRVIQFYYIDTVSVFLEIERISKDLNETNRIIKIPSPPPLTDNRDSSRYSWLLCQLQALESSDVVIAVGGKLDGAANMLLLLAESKNKLILPISQFGGAATQVLLRKRYELMDKLGPDFECLESSENIKATLELIDKLHTQRSIRNGKVIKTSSFFISYPRDRPNEADYIETLLRRRNTKVFRDDSDFGAGYSIPDQIREAIYASDVFIATWCKEYACSPWCYDELEIALDRFDSGKMEVWIFCVDDTRMVPKRARDRVVYTVSTRQEIEGKLLSLLNLT